MNEISRRAGLSLTAPDLVMLDHLVTSLVETRRGIAAFQALEAQLLHAANTLAQERVDASRSDGDLPMRDVAAEIGAALRVSDRTVQRQLGQASILAERFPRTLDALTTGRISRAHVHVIVDAGHRITDDEVRARFETAVLTVAEQESPSRLKGYARLTAERLLPRTLQERHQDATAGRRVDVSDLDDAMSQLTLVAASTLIHGIHDRLTHQARTVTTTDPDDPRTLDHLRADLLCDLALSGTPTAHEPAQLLGTITAEIHVTVPALTLANTSSHPTTHDGVLDAAQLDPAMLDGVQPIDTATALQLVGASPGWDRILTHPITGAVLAVDRYRPSADLRRYLRAIDQRCRFPGCMMPTRRCDLDHIHDAARGGPTNADNLTDKCRRHHVLKHHTTWTTRKQPDGTITWTSPTGRHYPDRTPPHVAFTTDTDPPPF
ncbi:DUF222 domain-containing protein [Microbacterium sp.]|uniref:HNH endonuclease signature motif containing protein n=1 Tax=Microbacterium sp. TaxID=51671 RepID=UPI0039E2E2EE